MKLAIVGGGASGVFLALNLAKENKNIGITIFEKNQVLASILPTGGGRCNLSHDIHDFKELASNYPRGKKALYSVFSRYGVVDTINYFESIGIKTYSDNFGRIYPVSNSSRDVREKLLSELEKYNNISIIKKEIKSRNELIGFDFIVLSGGSKGCYELAELFGHSITPLRSSLCGYITKEKFPPGVSINYNDKEILFTHFGVSGPYIFYLSSVNAYNNFPFKLELDILDFSDLMSEVKKFPKLEFGTILAKFIPKSVVSTLLSEELRHLKCANVSNELIKSVVKIKLTVTGVDKKGETVKAGGVSINEVDNNFNSKIQNNLYFTGEILDVDGLCGGFNLQFAWSSAKIVAFDILNKIN